MLFIMLLNQDLSDLPRYLHKYNLSNIKYSRLTAPKENYPITPM